MAKNACTIRIHIKHVKSFEQCEYLKKEMFHAVHV